MHACRHEGNGEGLRVLGNTTLLASIVGLSIRNSAVTTTVAVDTRGHSVVAKQTELQQNSLEDSVAVADKENKLQQNSRGHSVAVADEENKLHQNSRGHSVAVTDKENKLQQNSRGHSVAVPDKENKLQHNYRGHSVAVADEENKLQQNGGSTGPENELIMKYYPKVCRHFPCSLTPKNKTSSISARD